MGSADRRVELFESVERLYRAHHAHPEDPDIPHVRAWLEDELGPTVSIRMAARLLGVSHSSLLRWIDRGEIGTAMTPAGRRELSVALALRLRTAIAALDVDGDRAHVLDRVLRQGRQRAEQLDPDMLIVEASRGGHGHRRAELRSLAIHRAIAPRVDEDAILDARHTVARSRRHRIMHPDYATAWEELLAEPLAIVREVISADTERSRDLRQNTPLVGLISEPERRRILAAIT